jgi:hypothetical protein
MIAANERMRGAMKLRMVGVTLLVAAFGYAGCGDSGDYGGGYDDYEPDDSDDPPAVEVTGDWDTHWGSTQSDMSLSQSGASVSGTYELATSYGSISGTLSGRTLKGSWSDQYGSGSIEFVFSADGDSFNGTWSGGPSWTGTRVTDGGSPTGSYTDSCTECEIDSGRLCCYCPTSSGWESWTCLDLPCSEEVANCNGALTCGDC